MIDSNERCFIEGLLWTTLHFDTHTLPQSKKVQTPSHKATKSQSPTTNKQTSNALPIRSQPPNLDHIEVKWAK